jgi:hypothetical protein
VEVFWTYDWLPGANAKAISFRDLRHPGLEAMSDPSGEEDLERVDAGKRSCEICTIRQLLLIEMNRSVAFRLQTAEFVEKFARLAHRHR